MRYDENAASGHLVRWPADLESEQPRTFTNPLPVPLGGALDDPQIMFTMSQRWSAVVLCVLDTLTLPGAWQPEDEERGIQGIEQIIAQQNTGAGTVQQLETTTVDDGAGIFRIGWNNEIRYPLLSGTADLIFTGSPVQAAIAINQEPAVPDFGTAIRYVVYNASATHLLDDKFYAFDCGYMACSWQLQSAQSRYTWTINLHGIANGSQLLNRFTCTVQDINQPSGLRFRNVTGDNVLASIENVHVFAYGEGVVLEQP